MALLKHWRRFLPHPSLALLSFVLAAGWMAVSALWIGVNVRRFQDYQMDLDEATHATRGLDFASAVTRGDYQELWHHLVKPHWYPPFNGVLLGGWFLTVGASTFTARLYTTLCYFLLGLLLWASARQLSPGAPLWVCLIPPLFLAADGVYTSNAALSMLELPAVLASLAALYSYTRARKSGRLLVRCLALLLGVMSLLIKYNYGLVVLAALGLSDLVEMGGKLLRRENPGAAFAVMVAWLPALLVAGIWFVGLKEWQWLNAYANAQPAQYSFWSKANLLYYPRMLLSQPSGWLAILFSFMAGLMAIRQHRYDFALLPYGAFFVFGLALLTYVLQDAPRFGMLLFPPLWLGAAEGMQGVLTQPGRQNLHRGALLLILLTLGLAGVSNHLALSSRLPVEYENSNNGVDQAYRFIAATLQVSRQEHLRLVILGNKDQWSGPALRFYLESQCLFAQAGCEMDVQDEFDLRRGRPPQKYSKKDQQKRYDSALAEADYLVLFSVEPENLSRWRLVAEGEFYFKIRNHPPELHRVAILQPQSGVTLP
jgi:hypothetical protein